MKNEKIALTTSHLQEIRGHALATLTVRAERLLRRNNKPGSDDKESDENETWVKHGALTVKERQVIMTVWVLMRVIVVTSERSATSFAFR